MSDLETVIFDALYREGFSKAGSSGERTKVLAKAVAVAIETPPLERLAQWMIANSFATGHGDTFEELLSELEWQVRELRDRLAQKEGRAEARPEISKPNCKPHHRPAQPKEITR